MKTGYGGGSSRHARELGDGWIDRIRYSADLLSPILMAMLFAQTLALFTADLSWFGLAGTQRAESSQPQSRPIGSGATARLPDALPGPGGQPAADIRAKPLKS